MKYLPQDFPDISGVYFFKNTTGNVLYIGKAKSLKKRIGSYFKKQDTDWKIRSLLEEHGAIEYIVTHSEREALLLEAQLIQDYKPKYNVLLTSGNPFLYILFKFDEHPEIKLVRTKREKGTYIGPFLHKASTRSVFDYLVRTFQLRCCSKKINSGCLDYHLGNCAGTCLDTFDWGAYRLRMNLAYHVLDGKFDDCKKFLDEQFRIALEERAFERAKNIHGYLQNLKVIFETLETCFKNKWYDAELFPIIMPAVLHGDITRGLKDLQNLLGLLVEPRVIDCFDISHFQGRFLVGSCVRFTDGKPDHSGFRRFRIRTLIAQNDCAALREVVMRRY